MKIWIFPPLAFVWPSKNFLAFFQFSWPSDILNIQNHSNLSYFEAILPLKQFLLKIWQSGLVCKQAWVTISDFLHRTAVVWVGCKSKATNGKAFVNVIFVCETVRKIVWWGSCSTIEVLTLMELQDTHIR